MTTKKVRFIGIGIGAIAAVLIAIMIVSSVPQITKTIIPYVTVSGSASTIGAATKPVSIDFTSDTGSTTSVNVGEDGTYSITLDNQHTYSMTVHYSAGYGLTSGTCNAGILGIYTSSSSMDRNISC